MTDTKLLPCPFCGNTPSVQQGKVNHCQLHGDPYQAVIIRCIGNDCYHKPNVEGGDIFNGGFDDAKQKAADKWNRRAPATTSPKTMRSAEEWELWFLNKPREETFHDFIRDIQADAQQAQTPCIPAGHVVVREEPTEKMLDAVAIYPVNSVIHESTKYVIDETRSAALGAYKDMISASPPVAIKTEAEVWDEALEYCANWFVDVGFYEEDAAVPQAIRALKKGGK